MVYPQRDWGERYTQQLSVGVRCYLRSEVGCVGFRLASRNETIVVSSGFIFQRSASFGFMDSDAVLGLCSVVYCCCGWCSIVIEV